MSDLLLQAAKYRQFAGMLPPNLPGPQGKDYYLRMALELELQAAGAVAGQQQNEIHPHPGAAGVITPKPAPHPEPAQPAAPKFGNPFGQVKIHQRLALAVLADKRPNIHRAFTIWATLRTRAQTWHLTADVIREYAAATGKSERAVRRWLDAGDGLFWHIGSAKNAKSTLWLRGKNAVFTAYRLIRPGKVYLVKADELLGGLQDVRARLFGLWVDKSSRWAARATIRVLTGAAERSQLNYDAINRQQKQPVFMLRNDEAQQLPNRYHAVFHPKNSNASQGQRFGLYTPDFNGSSSFQVDDGLKAVPPVEAAGLGDNGPKERILFDNANGALNQVERRAKAGKTGNVFIVTQDGFKKKNTILVRSIGYANGKVYT